ncbi:MAG TPA: 2-octaprenyl-6-methoxyphenyl hydroxylase [Arenimonas sp.]|nr:2-octaprenyl-6-methoxyphenyl hydroxylase [Arenimonas sp.]
MQPQSDPFDLAIVGGGLVGTSLACALEPYGLRIALIEAAESAQAVTGFDQRKLALSKLSLEALDAFGVLDRLRQRPTAIERIHVSRTGDFGRVLLNAVDFGHAAFGGVVLAQELGHALSEQVATLKNTQRFCPASLAGCSLDGPVAELRLVTADGPRLIHARWVAAADGTQSFIRGALGIGTQEHDYRQTVFVCSLQAEKASEGTAYERFSEQGPVALLPMADGQYGSICGVASEQEQAVAALSDAGYADYLQQRFGWRVGKIQRVGKRSHYPLRRVLAERVAAKRCVLLGNAAQTIHPIGAQGFNLGLRDALGFAALVRQYGIEDGLAGRYAQSRAEDRERTLAFSDGLAKLTSNPGLPMHALRSLALSGLGLMPHLAAPMVSSAMGMRQHDLLDVIG